MRYNSDQDADTAVSLLSINHSQFTELNQISQMNDVEYEYVFLFFVIQYLQSARFDGRRIRVDKATDRRGGGGGGGGGMGMFLSSQR